MTQMGSWTAYPAAVQRPGPYYINAAPSSGSGSYTTMNVTVGHTAGPGTLSMVHVLIGKSIADIKPCQIVYFPSSNSLNLINDGGTGFASDTWMTPGTGAGAISNSRCSVSGLGLMQSRTQQQLNLAIPVTFAPLTFGGEKNIYINAFDSGGC
jgi:hypothetical protein